MAGAYRQAGKASATWDDNTSAQTVSIARPYRSYSGAAGRVRDRPNGCDALSAATNASAMSSQVTRPSIPDAVISESRRTAGLLDLDDRSGPECREAFDGTVIATGWDDLAGAISPARPGQPSAARKRRVQYSACSVVSVADTAAIVEVVSAHRGLRHGRIPRAGRHQIGCGRIPTGTNASAAMAGLPASSRRAGDRS